MKILIIGGAGLIGSKLENILVENGHETLVLDNFVGANRDFVDIKGKTVTGSACSFSILNNVFSWFHPTVVFHMADDVIDKESNYCFETESDVCVSVATNIMRCIRQYAVEYVFFGSSGEVYKGGSKRPLKETSTTGNLSYTGITNNYVESLFKLNSVRRGFEYKYTSLRYFGVYGERYFINHKHDVVSYWVDSLSHGFPIVLSKPEAYLDILSVDDAVIHTYKVFNSVISGQDIKEINIGSGIPIKLIDLYKKVSNKVVGGLVKPYYYKGPTQSRSLVADTKKVKSLGAEVTKDIDQIIEEIVIFRGNLDGRL